MITSDHGPTLRFEPAAETEVRLERLTAHLAIHGLAIPPGSRLARFALQHKRFKAKELSPAGHGSLEDFNELVEGSRDFAELATIARYLLPPGPPADSVLLKKLRLVLGGARFPRDDANALARNTQFELYACALFEYAGISTLLREPDGILTRGGVRLGVAAKRPGSVTHVSRLVREGAKQLMRAKLAGFVALSLDRVFDQKDAVIVARTPDDLKPAAPELLHATVRPLLPALDAAVVDTPALGLLASVVVVAIATETNTIGRVGGIFLHAFPHKRPTGPQFELLQHLALALVRPPDV